MVRFPEGSEMRGVRIDRGHEEQVEEETQRGGCHKVHETYRQWEDAGELTLHEKVPKKA